MPGAAAGSGTIGDYQTIHCPSPGSGAVMRVSHLQAGQGMAGAGWQEAGCSSAATNFLTRQHKLPPATLIIPVSTRITPSHPHLWPAFIPWSSDTTLIVSCPMFLQRRGVCRCVVVAVVTRDPVTSVTTPQPPPAQSRHAHHPHPPAGLRQGVLCWHARNWINIYYLFSLERILI